MITLAGFDQDEWARLGDYESWPARTALEMFRLLREANLRMFGRLTPDEWRRCGIHAERGRITVADLARHMAAHDVNHMLQVRRIAGAPLEAILPRPREQTRSRSRLVGNPVGFGRITTSARTPETLAGPHEFGGAEWRRAQIHIQ